MAPSLLLSLPPELLALVTFELEAAELVRLYLTGTNLLMNRLALHGGAKTFRMVLRTESEPSFPLIAGKFRSLEHFSITRDGTPCRKQLDVSGVDLSVLPPTLLELGTVCNNYETVLDSDLPTLFPRLRDLSFFFRVRRPAYKGALGDLPKTLLRLQLPYMLAFQEFSLLPITLRELEVRHEPVLANEWQDSFSFPPELETLRLSGAPDDSFVTGLPRTLTILDVDDMLLPAHRAVHTERIVASLPRKLVRLRWAFQALSASIVHKLPPSLTELVLEMHRPAIFMLEWCKLLPRSLKIVEIDDTEPLSEFSTSESLRSAVELIQSMPQTLVKWPFWLQEILIGQSCFRALPRSLETISSDRIEIQPGWLQEFPSSIRTLNISSNDFECLDEETLPPALSHLVVSSQRQSLKPVLECIFRSNLRHLREVSITSAADSELEDVVRTLPKSLNMLEIWGSPEDTAAASQDENDFSEEDLGKFTIVTDRRDKGPEDPFAAFRSTIPYWPRFSQLTCLSLYDAYPVDSQVIMALPMTLEDLSIEVGGDTKISKEVLLSLNHFPRLRDLSLEKLEPFGNEHLHQLPPSLISCMLTDEHCDCTEEIFGQLPPRLHSLIIPPTPMINSVDVKYRKTTVRHLHHVVLGYKCILRLD